MSAGPYPTRTMFEQLATSTRTTLLDPGETVTVSPSSGPVTAQPVTQVLLRGGGADLLIREIGLDLPVEQVDVAEIGVYATPDGTGAPLAYGVVQAVTHPFVPSLPDWSQIRLGLLRLPAGGSLRITLAQAVTAQTRADRAGSSTPGATVTLLGAQGALTGLVYVAAYPPEQTQAGRLARGGMRVVSAPTALGPGDFEIVDDGAGVPVLRYVSRSGAEFTWAGVASGTPGGGGAS